MLDLIQFLMKAKHCGLSVIAFKQNMTDSREGYSPRGVAEGNLVR